MENIYNFNMTEILAFAMVLLRMIGFVVSMPIIGTTQMPTQVKVFLALAMTFILFPQVGWQKLTVNLESMEIITLAIKEIFVGLTFGFVARLFFMAVTMAGQIMSISLGLSSAQLFNPSMGEVSTSLDQFYFVLAAMFFFAIQGHHTLITGIFTTFDLVPLSKMTIELGGIGSFAVLVSKVTAMALKLSAPIMVAILFMNVAIAVVGRAVPQINILITSLPVNALSGFFVMFFALPLMIWQMTDLVNLTADELFKFIKAF